MNKSTYVIGIDPGQKGAIAIHDITMGWVWCSPLPFTDTKKDKRLNAGVLVSLIRQHTAVGVEPIDCFVERIHAMPRQGVVSTCNFCRGAGAIEGAVRALGLRYYEVTPQKWKAHVIGKAAPGKEAAIEYVEKNYPDLDLYPGKKRTPHDGMADAICIADYGRYHT